MKRWFDDVQENDREEARDAYTKAKSFEEKLKVLQDWHPKGHLTRV